MQLLQSPKLLLENLIETIRQILPKMKQRLVSQHQLHLQEQSCIWLNSTVHNC